MNNGNFLIEEKSPKKSPTKHRKKNEEKFDLTEIEEDDDGSPLKKLEFIAVIGEGAFGKVYQGRTHRTQEECAIKAKIKSFSLLK